MATAPEIFDAGLISRRRDRIAGSVCGHDFLLQRVAEDFADRLAIVRRTFPRVLNLGAYHGLVSRHLRGLPEVETIIDLEPSPLLLALCDGPRVQGSVEVLSFAPGSLDLVVSGLALHLVDDVPGALVQVCRALKPDGMFLAALLGSETLKELREAWLVAEEELTGGASPRVAPFADVRALGALLQRAGFALPVADSDVVRVTYATPLHLMRELKSMGASNMLAARRRAPVTKRLLQRATEIYAERFGTEDGRVAATFEIVTLTGWSPHESQQKPLRPGSAQMRLSDALGVPPGGTTSK
jgi:SAM-dependent methyltransferase